MEKGSKNRISRNKEEVGKTMKIATKLECPVCWKKAQVIGFSYDSTNYIELEARCQNCGIRMRARSLSKTYDEKKKEISFSNPHVYYYEYTEKEKDNPSSRF